MPIEETSTQYILIYPVVAQTPSEDGKFVTVELLLREGDEVAERTTREYVFSAQAVPHMLTSEPNDPGTHDPQELYLNVIAKSVMILLESAYNIKISEVQRIAMFLENQVANYHADAKTVLFGKREHDLTLSDLRQIINNQA